MRVFGVQRGLSPSPPGHDVEPISQGTLMLPSLSPARIICDFGEGFRFTVELEFDGLR